MHLQAFPSLAKQEQDANLVQENYFKRYSDLSRHLSRLTVAVVREGQQITKDLFGLKDRGGLFLFEYTKYRD